MKLEVGMYARLHGKIGKIEHICMCEQCKLRGFYEPVVDFGHEGSDYVSVYWKDDLKASHNIIDLIEVGDYVNGSKVEEIFNDINGKKANIVTTECYVGQENMEYDVVLEEDIKTVVTKEQFESMQYKVN